MKLRNRKVRKALKEFLRKFQCWHCEGTDLSFFNAGVYNNPALELIYRCRNKGCGKVDYLMLGDDNHDWDKRELECVKEHQKEHALTQKEVFEKIGKLSKEQWAQLAKNYDKISEISEGTRDYVNTYEGAIREINTLKPIDVSIGFKEKEDVEGYLEKLKLPHVCDFCNGFSGNNPEGTGVRPAYCVNEDSDKYNTEVGEDDTCEWGLFK